MSSPAAEKLPKLCIIETQKEIASLRAPLLRGKSLKRGVQVWAPRVVAKVATRAELAPQQLGGALVAVRFDLRVYISLGDKASAREEGDDEWIISARKWHWPCLSLHYLWRSLHFCTHSGDDVRRMPDRKRVFCGSLFLSFILSRAGGRGDTQNSDEGFILRR